MVAPPRLEDERRTRAAIRVWQAEVEKIDARLSELRCESRAQGVRRLRAALLARVEAAERYLGRQTG